MSGIWCFDIVRTGDEFRMKPICWALATGAMWLAFVDAAAAQAPPQTELPPVTVLPPPSAGTVRPAPGKGTGPASGGASPNPCASAPSGSPEALNCLNQKLKQQVEGINPGPTTPSAPLDARSPDTKVGVVNVPAVKEQYGKNFGISAVPFRPAR
jgi:hypothetical protein